MTTFVDTSGLYAFLDSNDPNNGSAKAFVAQVSAAEEVLLTHNYVVLEAAALVQRRLGGDALRGLLVELIPKLDVVFVDEALHDKAVAAHIAALPRRTSLVDLVSFEVMRERGIERAFAFDEDFSRAGFEMVRPTRRERPIGR